MIPPTPAPGAALATFYRRWGKRSMDITIAGAALILVAPLCAAIAILVRCSLGPPVLFRDVRAKRGGAPFVLRKFRTMTNQRDAQGALLPDAQRLTRVGRLLRQWSLDELPELLNVLTGDMSLVGPRPLPLRYIPRYTSIQAQRLLVPPGVTGLAQSSGRNSLSWDERFALDVQYVENCTFSLDLRLLLATAWVVVRRTGVSHPGHDTMYEFSGSSR